MIAQQTAAPDSPALPMRVPPQSIQAEACVLGSMMLDPSCVPQVTDILAAESFYRPAHQLIFRVLVEMSQQGKPLDLVTARDEMLARKLLDQIGGDHYLVALAEGVPTAANVVYYAGIVRDRAMLRGLIVAMTDAVQRAFSPMDQPATELIAEAQTALVALEQHAGGERACQTSDAAPAYDAIVERAHERQRAGASVGLMTGYHRLDEALGGLRPGNLSILAAVTGAGKTTVACSITAQLCLRGASVLYISGEMPWAELMERFAAAQVGIPLGRFRQAALEEDDYRRLADARDGIRAWSLRMVGRPMRVAEIGAELRRFRMDLRRPVDLVVVDYLQKMRGRPGFKSRYEEVSGISNDLKALALDMGVPVLAAAQLRREVGQQARPPGMHDLKESGELENDADHVLLLHNPEMGQRADGSFRIWLKVAKNRSGNTTPWPADKPGEGVELAWWPTVTRMDDAAE